MEECIKRMFKQGLAGSLRNLVISQHFYKGDTSWITNEEGALEYLPIYHYMFIKKYEFWSGNLDNEDVDSTTVPNQGIDLCKLYLKPNPYIIPNCVVSSWIKSTSSGKQYHIDKVIDLDIHMLDIVDLGDSRNFKNIAHILYKIRKIQQSYCYIGSATSWCAITRMYNKPSINLWPKKC